MSVSIKHEFNSFNSQQEIELRRAFEAILTDLTALKSAHDTLATKLNSDTGVADTDYAAASSLTLIS